TVGAAFGSCCSASSTALSKQVPFLFLICYIAFTPSALRERSPASPRQVASSAGGDQLGGAVVYRKGELSKGTIDRNWPHQVALPAARCGGANHVTIRLFCEDEKLSLCVRGHSFRSDDVDVIVSALLIPSARRNSGRAS